MLGVEGSEGLERSDDLFLLGQGGDWLRLETGAWSAAGFELSVEDQGGEGEFFFWERELDAKGGRRRQMTDSKTKAARRLMASGRPPKEVAHSLGVSVPTLYRWVPASARTERVAQPVAFISNARIRINMKTLVFTLLVVASLTTTFALQPHSPG